MHDSISHTRERRKGRFTFFILSPNFFPFFLTKKENKKMAVGFVLMHVSPLRGSKVFNKLSKLPEIIEVHPLIGEYDFIAKKRVSKL